MRRLLASAALGALTAAPAAAATLRGGEHGAFTRLAFTADGPVSWAVEGYGRAATIRFDGAVPALELSEAFERIGRQRVAAVSWRDGTLGLDLGCDCVPSVRQRTDDVVVIDVVPRAGDETLPSSLRGPLLVSVPVEATVAPSAPDAMPTPMPVPVPVPVPAPVYETAAVSVPAEMPPAKPPAPPPTPPVPPTPPAPSTSDVTTVPVPVPVGVPLVLEPIRVPLGERLDRALRDQVVDASPMATLPGPLPAVTPKPDGAQIRTRDARALAGPPGLRPAVGPAASCEGAEALRTPLLADPAEARAALPELKAAFAEGDVAEAYALHGGYLAAGLGTEAARLARAAEVKGAWLPLLADVLDADLGAETPTVAWGCGAETVLLALTAASPPEPITDETADQVAALVGLMSAERRRDILPRVIARLEAAGEARLAARLDGLPGAQPPDDPLNAAEARAETLAGELVTNGAELPDAEASQDALAMLSTLPEGAARHDLAAATAAAVAVEGDLSALGLVMDGAGPELRTAALDAIARMWTPAPPERRGVLAAALLRWRDDAGPSARDAFATAAEAEGLATVAGRWRGPNAAEILRPDLARADPGLGDVDTAWLSRDLDAAAATASGGEAKDAPTRARLAALLTAPIEAAPADTFQGAADRLARARAARSALSGLLAEGDSRLAATAGSGARGTDR